MLGGFCGRLSFHLTKGGLLTQTSDRQPLVVGFTGFFDGEDSVNLTHVC